MPPFAVYAAYADPRWMAEANGKTLANGHLISG